MTPPTSSPNVPGREFAAEVATLLAGLGYVVVETDRGFDVRRDLAHVRWRTIPRGWKAWRRRTIYALQRVILTGDGTFSVTERSHIVGATRSGVDPLTSRAAYVFGRSRVSSFRKTWAVRGLGRPKLTEESSFDSDEVRRAIADAAGRLGLTQKRGAAERVGLILGILGGAGAIVTAVVLVVLALTGAL